MSFIASIQAERLIGQIQDQGDPASPAAQKALHKLARLGPDAIPRLLDALASADRDQTMAFVEALSALLNDKTLRLVAQGLADTEPRTVSGTTWAMSSNRHYNVNRLVDLLEEDAYSSSAIMEILAAHKDRLNVQQLLAQVYHLQPNEKAALFKLVEDIATEDLVPDLIERMGGKDPIVKMHLIQVITRFDRPEVQRAIEVQLHDPNKLVRQAALHAIPRLGGRIDPGVIAALLLDPDVEVMNKAADVLIKLNDPDTARHLLPALKAEHEFSRRAAVEVLNEVGTTRSIKYLLEAVADNDWWVRARASDALAKIGGPRVVDAVLELIRDENEDVRRAAIEILNSCQDERAVDQLIIATQDDDWWVSERAADALGEIGDPKAIPALVKMLARNDRSVPVAIRSLGKLGDERALVKIAPALKLKDKAIRLAAIEAVAELATERNIKAARAHIRQAAFGNDETIVQAVGLAVQKLDGRLAASGQYASPVDSTGSAPTRIAPGKAGDVPAMSTTSPTSHTMLVDGQQGDDEAGDEQPALDISALAQGDLIDARYRFVRKIGKGAFGTVVLVEDTVVEEQLILKFLNPNVAADEEMMQRFVHELRYSRRITHKNVIRIYDFLYICGAYAISMEYFPSHTLANEIANDGPMDPQEAIGYATEICLGMINAHQQGIVHRDLKPANILINDEGILKIVDFGVAAAAKSGDTQLTKTGYVIGSPKYMAPEQILGKKVDERADIYSLAIMLYEMLSGNPPYSRGDHMSVMYQHVQGKAQPLVEANSKVPDELAAIVAQGMMVDKTKRFASMEALKNALAAVAPKCSVA